MHVGTTAPGEDAISSHSTEQSQNSNRSVIELSKVTTYDKAS